MLHERGLWREGMLLEIDEDDAKGRDQASDPSLPFRFGEMVFPLSI